MAEFAGSRKICLVSQESPWASAGSSSWQSHSWGQPQVSVQPHSGGRGSWGGTAAPSAQLCLCPAWFLGPSAGVCPFPTISWETHSSSRAFCGCGWRWKTPGTVRAGVLAVWDLSGLCLSLQSWLTKVFTYRIVRFCDMKYLYFLVICSF